MALAALKGDRTVNKLASQYGSHLTLIHAWKKQLRAGADPVFSNGSKAVMADAAAEKAYCSSRSVSSRGTACTLPPSPQVSLFSRGWRGFCPHFMDQAL